VTALGEFHVVPYTLPVNENTVKCAAGCDLLMLVGTKTITYNDKLGRSKGIPIESQKPATKSKQSK
jgi:hypothetical protein